MKNIIITGASSGIGRETAIACASNEYHLVLTGRNMERLESVRQQILLKNPLCRVDTFPLDLNSVSQISAFSEYVHEKFSKIDILVNNAGTYCNVRMDSELGFEYTMGINFIGTFLLTDKVLGLVKKSPEGRIINISSDAYKFGKINYLDFDMIHKFHGFKAYAASKRSLSLFTLYLADYLNDSNVSVNAVHPGHVATNIWNYAKGKNVFNTLFAKINSALAIPSDQGAKTAVFLINQDSLKGVNGNYYKKCIIVPWKKDVLDENKQNKLIEYTVHRLRNKSIKLSSFSE